MRGEEGSPTLAYPVTSLSPSLSIRTHYYLVDEIWCDAQKRYQKIGGQNREWKVMIGEVGWLSCVGVWVELASERHGSMWMS